MTRQMIHRLIGILSWLTGIYLFLTFFIVNFRPEFFYSCLDCLSRPEILLIISFFIIWGATSSVVKWRMLLGKHEMWINIMSVISFGFLFYFFYKGPLRLPDEAITLIFYLTMAGWVAIDLIDLLLIDIFEKPVVLKKPEIPEASAIPKIKKSPRKKKTSQQAL